MGLPAALPPGRGAAGLERLAKKARRARRRPGAAHPREPRQPGDAAGRPRPPGAARRGLPRRAQPGRAAARRERHARRRCSTSASRCRTTRGILPYYFYMCDMIPNSEHWRTSVAEAQQLQHDIMGYLPGFATPRIVCDVPYVGKRWVHQVAEYDREKGISYWTKNYRTGIEDDDPEALHRRYEYYDPIPTLPESGQAWWRRHTRVVRGADTGLVDGHRAAAGIGHEGFGAVNTQDTELRRPGRVAAVFEQGAAAPPGRYSRACTRSSNGRRTRHLMRPRSCAATAGSPMPSSTPRRTGWPAVFAFWCPPGNIRRDTREPVGASDHRHPRLPQGRCRLRPDRSRVSGGPRPSHRCRARPAAVPDGHRSVPPGRRDARAGPRLPDRRLRATNGHPSSRIRAPSRECRRRTSPTSSTPRARPAAQRGHYRASTRRASSSTPSTRCAAPGTRSGLPGLLAELRRLRRGDLDGLLQRLHARGAHGRRTAFGDELGQYLSSLGITYFSTVPTMLATMARPSEPAHRQAQRRGAPHELGVPGRGPGCESCTCTAPRRRPSTRRSSSAAPASRSRSVGRSTDTPSRSSTTHSGRSRPASQES